MKSLLSVCLGLLGMFVVAAHAEDAPATAFAITSTAYLDQMTIPVLYTCQGKDISPQLDWANVPPKAQSLAIVMTDPDAPGGTFYHWVIYNIPKSSTTLPEGMDKVPTGATIGKNSFGKTQYNGPCPPKGTAHSYIITLYALDNKLDLPAGTDGKTVLNTIETHIVGKVTLTGVYTPWPPA